MSREQQRYLSLAACFFIVLFLSSCANKVSVKLWKEEIDFSKYKKAYYVVSGSIGNDSQEQTRASMALDDYLLDPLGFDISKRKELSVEKNEEFIPSAIIIRDKKGVLFVRSEFEHGLSIPPRPYNNILAGFIWTHRTKTFIRLIDMETKEDLATLKYERRYFDGKIPEEVLYKLLMKAIREKKDYLEND